jgi:hypothetical protein
MMIALSDLIKDGQHMDYIDGFHKNNRVWIGHEVTRYSQRDLLKQGNPIHCNGEAGIDFI